MRIPPPEVEGVVPGGYVVLNRTGIAIDAYAFVVIGCIADHVRVRTPDAVRPVEGSRVVNDGSIGGIDAHHFRWFWVIVPPFETKSPVPPLFETVQRDT